MSAQERLDQQIDALLAGRKPDPQGDTELAGLLQVAREVRQATSHRRNPRKRPWIGRAATALAAAAAVLLLAFLLPGAGERSVVLAMEQALANLHSYHGVLERSWEGAGTPGSEQTEIWWAGDRYKVVTPGGVRYSDGQTAWSVSPDRQQATRSLALGTGEEFQPWDIRLMAKYALRFPAKPAGSERIAGRKAAKLELERPGGESWYLWIDTETHLPLQFQRRTDVLETFRFVRFEANPPLPDELFAYTPPATYQVQARDQRWAGSVAEAAQLTGFTPLLPQEAPRRVAVAGHSIVLDFGDTLIYQTRTEHFQAPTGWGFLKGTAAGGTLYLQADGHLRWHQQGIAIEVRGARSLALAQQIAPDLSLPDPKQDLVSGARVKVAVDMAEANQVQRRVDALTEDGHNSYPVQVAWAFVNGLSHQELDRPTATVPEWMMTEAANTGVEAVVTAAEGPISRFYVKRVVRQDFSGAWFLVGYDPR